MALPLEHLLSKSSQRSSRRGVPRFSGNPCGAWRGLLRSASESCSQLSCHYLLLFRNRGSAGNSFARAFDGILNPVVAHAAAQGVVHRLANLDVGRMRILVQKYLRGHDLSVLTESALRDLLVDPGLLQRVQSAVRRKPVEGGDFTLDGRCGRNAGTNCSTVDDYSACAALAKSAA